MHPHGMQQKMMKRPIRYRAAVQKKATETHNVDSAVRLDAQPAYTRILHTTHSCTAEGLAGRERPDSTWTLTKNLP
jgi:hypothetical protein